MKGRLKCEIFYALDFMALELSKNQTPPLPPC